MDDAKFSVIIPAYNVLHTIRECVRGVLANDTGSGGLEVIVVDDGSTDGTPEAARNSGAAVLETNGEGKHSIGALRNWGAAKSGGDVIVFLDADTVVPSDWLYTARKHFRDGFRGALGFIFTVPGAAGWVGRAWGSRSTFPDQPLRQADFLPGCNIFISREVFEEVKGFDESLRTSEDKDFGFRVSRAGYPVRLSAEISVTHLGYERGLWDFMKKEFWRQGSTLLFAQRWGFSLRTMRNPAISFWHIVMPAAAALVLVLQDIPLAASLALSWMLPSALITFRQRNAGRAPGMALQFCLLTFLRWNVSGAALVWQILLLLFLGRIGHYGEQNRKSAGIFH